MDYAYTLQGWIKGVNSDKLDEINDIGKDGNLLGTATNYNNLHRHVARDAFGYSLNYFTNASQKDYVDISSLSAANRFASDATALIIGTTPVMYNGNIGSMVTSYLNQDPVAVNVSTGLPVAVNEPFPMANAYLYDQLNRVVRAKSSKVYNASTNSFTSSGDNKFRETFTYDANGNIVTVERFGNASTMDNLTYHYYKDDMINTYPVTPSSPAPADATNKLAYVSDAIGSGTYADDIDDQAAISVTNYTYDPIGNLTGDASEEIETIEWTVYGKIKSITRTSSSTKPDLEFAYDAQGNRVMKLVKAKNGAGSYVPSSRWVYTYYVRDAQGNVMATYQRHADPSDLLVLELGEQHIYGSSRLGILTNYIDLTNFTGAVNTTTVNRTLGSRTYELGNHLGNVIAVVSDKKIGFDGNSDGIIDYFSPDVLSNTDYYAFGQSMPGRQFNANLYKYGHGGQEKDDEIFEGAYTAEYWEYDSRLGRRWNLDPVVKPSRSRYSTFANNPIAFADPTGLDERNQQQANKKDAKDGDTYVDKNGSSFSYNGGLKEWLPTEPGQLGNGSSETPALSAASTYGATKPGDTDHLGFDVMSVGGEVALIGGVNPSVKEYRTGNNPKKLWSNALMRTYETDVVMGYGASVGLDYGQGQFNSVGPWENPFQRVINASDADVGLEYAFLRGSYNTGDGTYSYSSFGVGIGFGIKGLDNVVKDIDPILTNNPASLGTGIHDPIILYIDKPTFTDSVRTALNNRGDSISESFLKKHPSVIPKCISCK